MVLFGYIQNGILFCKKLHEHIGNVSEFEMVCHLHFTLMNVMKHDINIFDVQKIEMITL